MIRIIRAFRLPTASASSLLAVVSSPCLSQVPPPGADSAEIVVTAQKRAERIQSVPISITALDGKALEARGQDDFARFSRSVPGLTFIDLGPGQSQISIRGINTGAVARDDTARKESVGVYLDEIPISVALFTPDLDTFDLNRVEVLRGPQGTLYGAGSLAGTVRLITNPPNVHSLQGKVDLTLSGTRSGGINHASKGMLNIPLVDDQLGLRAVGYYDFTSGFVDNVATGRSNVNSSRRYGGRLSLRYVPVSDLTITPSIVYQGIETHGFPLDDVSSIVAAVTPAAAASYPARYTRTSDPSNSALVLLGNPTGTGYDQYRVLPEGLNDDFGIANLTASYDFGASSLTASSSLLNRSVVVKRDITSFNDAVFGLPFNLNLPATSLTDRTKLKTFVQEVRLASAGARRFSYVIGMFYQHENRDYSQTILSPGFERLTGIPVSSAGVGADTLYKTAFGLRLRQFAAFGEATYRLPLDFAITGGLRWYDYTQSRTAAIGGLYNGLVNSEQNTSTSASGFTPKALITYTPSRNILISAQASEGFKLGGPNDPIPSICSAEAQSQGIFNGEFKPEKVWNYELGFKTSWMGERVTINGDIFQMNYKDLQLNRRLACSFTVTTNGGQARSRGVELELTAKPARGLSLSMGGSYISAILLSDEPSLHAKRGDRLPLSAKLSLTANARYQLRSEGLGTPFVDISYQHVGSLIAYFNSSFFGAALPDAYDNHVPAFDLVDLRVGLTVKQVEASIFLNNLFDKRAGLSIDRELVGFFNDGSSARDARVGVVRNQPRTIGINVKASF